LNFRIKKQFKTDVRFSILQIDIVTPSDNTINLNPSFIQVNGQVAPAYLSGINLRDPLVNAEATMMFERSQFARIAIANQLTQSLGQFWWQKQCKDGLDDSTAELFRKYFVGAFAWEPGQYKANIQYRIDNNPGSYVINFVVGSQDSSRLKNVGDKLKYCAGLAFDLPQIVNISYVDAEAANYITKTATILESH
jgi:hypothetical protein